MAEFKPGQSGNPKGRPKGRLDRRTAWRKELEPNGHKLMAKAVELALAGDTQALRLCLERLTPAIKPRGETIQFELAGDTISEKAESVLAAIADGSIPPDSGKALLDALASLSRIAEIDEFKRRLEALETGS